MIIGKVRIGGFCFELINLLLGPKFCLGESFSVHPNVCHTLKNLRLEISVSFSDRISFIIHIIEICSGFDN